MTNNNYPIISGNFSRSDGFGTLKELLILTQSMLSTGYSQTRPIIVSGNVSQYDGSAHSTIEDMVLVADWGDDDSRKVSFVIKGEEKPTIVKMTKDDLLAAIETHKTKSKEAHGFEPIDGNRRGLAVVLCAIVGVEVTPVLSQADGDKDALNFEGNSIHTLGTVQLDSAQELASVVALIQKGTFKRQSQIPAKRGRQQTLWHKAQAVIVQGLSVEDATVLPSYKEARAIVEAKTQDEVAKIIAEAAANKTNKAKTLPATKIQKAHDTATNANVKAALAAILADNETALLVAAKAE